jgi:hypothetical protein
VWRSRASEHKILQPLRVHRDRTARRLVGQQPAVDQRSNIRNRRQPGKIPEKVLITIGAAQESPRIGGSHAAK